MQRHCCAALEGGGIQQPASVHDVLFLTTRVRHGCLRPPALPACRRARPRRRRAAWTPPPPICPTSPSSTPTSTSRAGEGALKQLWVIYICRQSTATSVRHALHALLSCMRWLGVLNILHFHHFHPSCRQQVAAEVQQRLLGEPQPLLGTQRKERGFDVGSIAVWLTPVEDKSLARWRQVAEVALTGS